jgi:hypothetical protein
VKTAVAYVYPTVKRRIYHPLAKRFAESWVAHPPGRSPCTLYVLCNGAPPSESDRECFRGLSAQYLLHDNEGLDIGAYQMAAKTISCDLLVCFGAPVRFYRPGWLDRIMDAYLDNGPGLYGCACYLTPDWHVRTTAFWCPPELLQSYPLPIGSDRQSRYGFEHGPQSFTRHVLKAGFPCVMVTWTKACSFDQWRENAPTRDEVLVRDQHVL